MARERFSFTFDSRDMLLFFHIGFSFDRAAVAFAILVKVSDLAHLWYNKWVSFAPEFQCCYFCESSCLFYLSFNSDFYVSKIIGRSQTS